MGSRYEYDAERTVPERTLYRLDSNPDDEPDGTGTVLMPLLARVPDLFAVPQDARVQPASGVRACAPSGPMLPPEPLFRETPSAFVAPIVPPQVAPTGSEGFPRGQPVTGRATPFTGRQRVGWKPAPIRPLTVMAISTLVTLLVLAGPLYVLFVD